MLLLYIVLPSLANMLFAGIAPYLLQGHQSDNGLSALENKLTIPCVITCCLMLPRVFFVCFFTCNQMILCDFIRFHMFSLSHTDIHTV